VLHPAEMSTPQLRRTAKYRSFRSFRPVLGEQAEQLNWGDIMTSGLGPLGFREPTLSDTIYKEERRYQYQKFLVKLPEVRGWPFAKTKLFHLPPNWHSLPA
jgi:hypothetical protein